MGEDIKNSKILVTGGAGFIGSHIVDALLREKAKKIIVFDNFSRGRKENLKQALTSGKVKIFKGDIKNPSQLKKAIKGVDYVFHEAALQLSECEEEPKEAIETNIVGTFNVCEACVNANVKKIVVASSTSVYGDGLYFPIDEKHPLNSYLFYGAAKIADEQLFQAFWKKYGLNYITLRYFNIYGPRMDFYSTYVPVIMNFINKIAKGEQPIIFGDGSNTIDLVYVTDVVKANILALKSNIINEVFNVSSEKEVSLKELLNIILKITKSNLKPIYQPRNSKLAVRSFGRSEKAKKILGFKPEISLEEGLKKVIIWYDKNLRNSNHL